MKFAKTKIFGEQTATARHDVIAKKIASGLFQNLSGRPEDWTVSGRAISNWGYNCVYSLIPSYISTKTVQF